MSWGNDLERFLERRGNEQVVALEPELIWWAGSPHPIVLKSPNGTFTLIRGKEVGPPHPELDLIEWLGCSALRFGMPNDEAIDGRPLWSRGLSEQLWAGEVLDSSWIAEFEERNRVHPYHQPELILGARHFIIPLKDNTLEVVADGFRVETTREPYYDVLLRLLPNLLGWGGTVSPGGVTRAHGSQAAACGLHRPSNPLFQARLERSHPP